MKPSENPPSPGKHNVCLSPQVTSDCPSSETKSESGSSLSTRIKVDSDDEDTSASGVRAIYEKFGLIYRKEYEEDWTSGSEIEVDQDEGIVAIGSAEEQSTFRATEQDWSLGSIKTDTSSTDLVPSLAAKDVGLELLEEQMHAIDFQPNAIDGNITMHQKQGEEMFGGWASKVENEVPTEFFDSLMGPSTTESNFLPVFPLGVNTESTNRTKTGLDIGKLMNVFEKNTGDLSDSSRLLGKRGIEEVISLDEEVSSISIADSKVQRLDNRQDVAAPKIAIEACSPELQALLKYLKSDLTASTFFTIKCKRGRSETIQAIRACFHSFTEKVQEDEGWMEENKIWDNSLFFEQAILLRIGIDIHCLEEALPRDANDLLALAPKELMAIVDLRRDILSIFAKLLLKGMPEFKQLGEDELLLIDAFLYHPVLLDFWPDPWMPEFQNKLKILVSSVRQYVALSESGAVIPSLERGWRTACSLIQYFNSIADGQLRPSVFKKIFCFIIKQKHHVKDISFVLNQFVQHDAKNKHEITLYLATAIASAAFPKAHNPSLGEANLLFLLFSDREIQRMLGNPFEKESRFKARVEELTYIAYRLPNSPLLKEKFPLYTESLDDPDSKTGYIFSQLVILVSYLRSVIATGSERGLFTQWVSISLTDVCVLKDVLPSVVDSNFLSSLKYTRESIFEVVERFLLEMSHAAYRYLNREVRRWKNQYEEAQIKVIQARQEAEAADAAWKQKQEEWDQALRDKDTISQRKEHLEHEIREHNILINAVDANLRSLQAALAQERGDPSDVNLTNIEIKLEALEASSLRLQSARADLQAVETALADLVKKSHLAWEQWNTARTAVRSAEERLNTAGAVFDSVFRKAERLRKRLTIDIGIADELKQCELAWIYMVRNFFVLFSEWKDISEGADRAAKISRCFKESFCKTTYFETLRQF